MKDDRFGGVLVSGGIVKKDSCGTLCVRDVTMLLWKRVKFCIKGDIMFGTGRGNALWRSASKTMTTVYIHTCSKKVKKEVDGSRGCGNLEIANIDEVAQSFVSLVQLSSDKTAMTP